MELKTITVIETKSKTGTGTDEDPVRYLYEYWKPDGTKLAEFDTINEELRKDGTALRKFR